MSKHLPLTQFIPFSLTPVGIHTVPEPKPWLCTPIPSSNILTRIRSSNDYNKYSCTHDSQNADELGHHEEVIQSIGCFRADGIRRISDDQYDNRQELMLKSSSLVGYAIGREDAFYKDNAQNCQGRRHNGDNPSPCRQEAEDVAEDMLEIWLHAS